MDNQEIQSLCEATAQETGLPAAWVRHHVDQRAGKPCRRCRGVGRVAGGACFRCQGTGGNATVAKVEEALRWVRSNVERVRTLGERREANAPARRMRREHTLLMGVQEWKRDHPDLWAFLEDMLPGDFRDSMMKAVEEGRITDEQESALTKMVTEARRSRQAPTKGDMVEVDVIVDEACHNIDFRGRRVFRVNFVSQFGWRGRFETDKQHVIDKVQTCRGGMLTLKGTVVWSKGDFVVVGGNLDVTPKK